MQKTKELKQIRSLLYEECRAVRKNLKVAIEEAKSSTDEHREKILDKIEILNMKLNDLTANINLITEEIETQRVNKKPKQKKSAKVHNISGRYIDQTGFSGVVQA